MPNASAESQPSHWSSCAVYNEPAFPAGPCDCGGYAPGKPPPRLIPEPAHMSSKLEQANGTGR